MGRQRIEATAWTGAAAGTVWALLADGASWPLWSPIGSYELDKPGAQDKDGLGSVRTFRTRRATGTARLREEVVEFEPEKHLRYAVLSGLPVRDYVGSVELTGSGDRTRIHWSCAFSAPPGIGRLVRRSLSRVIADCANGLAEYADSR